MYEAVLMAVTLPTQPLGRGFLNNYRGLGLLFSGIYSYFGGQDWTRFIRLGFATH